VDGLESSRGVKREGNADDAARKFMELLGSESLLVWNVMLLEGFGWERSWTEECGWMCFLKMVNVFCEGRIWIMKSGTT
jgi:hypothetical protein